MNTQGSIYSTFFSLANSIGISVTIYLVVGFLGILFLYRLIRTIIGEKFSSMWLFMTPIFYSILVLISFVDSDIIQQISAAVTALIGILLGLKLSSRDEVYEKNNTMYYKKSIAVTFLWSLFFSVKMLTYLYYPQLYFQTLFTALLTLVTGMIVGEALRIYYRGRKYRNAPLNSR